MSSRSTAWLVRIAPGWGLTSRDLGNWIFLTLVIVVMQLGPVVLWESCCSHLLVVNWVF